MNRPLGIGDFLTELKEAAFKGDAPGHPFRGNQFEGGGDRGGVESKVDEHMRTRAANEAEKHGYKLNQRIRLDEESHGILTATSGGLMAGIEDTSGKIAGYMHPAWSEIDRWNKP